MSKAFIFLDRDGTLVRDPGYVHRLEDYALLDGVVEGLQLLRDAGYRFAILTNQSGIGRGHFGESDFTRFQGHLVRDLGSQDIKIEGTFHCPHGPEDGCSCRKPSAGLLRKAQAEFGADLSRSWMLGDSEADVGMARSGGIGMVRVNAKLSGRTPADGFGASEVPIFPDLLEAARYILTQPAD